MPDSNGTTRVSIPFGTTAIDAGEEALKRHSFDLIHFPAYLWRKVAPRVRVEIISVGQEDADLMGCFNNPEPTRTWKYARLVADERGCLTDSDDFYQLVHVTFAAYASESIYIGFTRCGQPPTRHFSAWRSCTGSTDTVSTWLVRCCRHGGPALRPSTCSPCHDGPDVRSNIGRGSYQPDVQRSQAIS